VITRALGVLVAGMGGAALLAGLALLGRAPGLPEATRHLRAMKDRVTAPERPEDVRMADFDALPHHGPFDERVRLERRGVRMEGWVQRIQLSGDGDVHLELSEVPRTNLDRDTAYVVGEITPLWRRHRRSWAYDSLLVTFRPNRGGPARWTPGPAHVRLTGWLCYDHPYDRPPSHWLRHLGSPRLTGWEIHPVTAIEVWDERSRAWQEVAR
jgi:hypothetical protein